jgi:integrase
MDGAVVKLDDARRKKKGEVVKYKTVKKTRDGEIKKTPNNTKLNRDNVYPFKEEDIPKMVKYLKNKIDNSTNHEDEMIARRNLTIFICGINIGLRCSDLVSLRWNDVYDKDYNFLEGKKITPKKTRRSNKHVLLKYNDDFKKTMDYYRHFCNIKDMNSYIFTSREGNHIEVDRVGQIIKKAAEEVGIKYNVNTHSMRKSFARLRYDNAKDKSKVLVELMKLFMHSSTKITMDYICISEDELEDLYNDVSIGFDAIFD